MPWTDLRQRFETEGVVVAGVLSGTSADGIDVVLARCFAERPPAPFAFRIVPFQAALARRMRRVLDGGACGLRETALLHRDLGRAFGEAVARVAREEGVTVELVGSHGQTVWHHDGDLRAGAATLQLGDADFVALAVGCPVVGDFRQADVAAGGDGAPISSYADDLVFGAAPRPLALLNLGGMANLGFLSDQHVLAFDTGPAGSLLDGLARRFLDRPYDDGGAFARGGRADAVRVEAWLAHPFFALPPPKSTGRDTFGEDWIDSLPLTNLAPADVLATGVELVARSIALGWKHLPEAPSALAVAGGGVHNLALMQRLRALLPVTPRPSDDFGVPSDAREALVFAVLAMRAVLGRGVTRPDATGALRGRVLGKISPGAQLHDPVA